MMTIRAHKLSGLLLVTAFAASALSCNKDTIVPGEGLTVGTWGGKDAGLIVNDSTAHLHIGCTFGDFASAVEVDGGGHFSVAGDYVLRAFPIQLGPSLPAQFTGEIAGNKVTLLVTVNDTVENSIVIKGPVTVTLGREPELGPCPICTTPRLWQ